MIPHNIILLDVGGTFIKCSDGRQVPIDSNGTREEIVSSLRAALGNLTGIDGVAVAIPGPFDYDNGVFLMKHKFAAVYGETFSAMVGAPEGIRFRFIHDVNAMLLGEVCRGAGVGYKRIAMVTLGTGLGFSMSIDGEILKNAAGSPAVSIYARPYKDGILEDYASKRGITRTYREICAADGVPAPADDITVKAISELGFGGNAQSIRTYAATAFVIGEAIAPILSEYGIECLLFGGQISNGFSLLEAGLNEALKGVSTLKNISKVSNIADATFNGLKVLLED